MEYSAIKREKTGSFAVLWMDLESFIQHEVRRKTSITYYHIYTESRKTVPMNLSTGQEQRHMCREWACGHSRKERVGQTESSNDVHTPPRVQQPVGAARQHGCSAQSLEGRSRRVGRRREEEGIRVYRWLTHAVVQQKPTQHRKAIILQFK